jgi:60 kDa SS-A/Ro ribonucleoprotein
MASLNRKSNTNAGSTLLTHEGAPAKRINALQQLRRSVMACLLWEDTFYEEGAKIEDRLKANIKELSGPQVAEVAKEAHTKFKLRHIPLLLVRLLAAGSAEQRKVVADALFEVTKTRPDQMTEFLSIYWKDKRQPLSAQVKKGLARAFAQFNEYQLAKYNKDGAVKLRDVLFLSHVKPVDDNQAALFKRVAENKLQTPDTWEVGLSGGGDKKETFTRLISENKLGAMALLRNLRNMQQAGVDEEIIRGAISTMKTERVLPFRFITAAKYAPKLEPQLETAMFKCLDGYPKLAGKTAILVDNSGSMYHTTVSKKSELERIDAACALAMLVREVCEDPIVIGYATRSQIIPARRGFALRDAIKAGPSGGTNTETAKRMADLEGYDRIIIITDEQSHQALSNPKGKGYVINVANYQNGIGYGEWIHIDGWSEAVMDYIREYESSGL